MKTVFVLVHSPLVGPFTWRLVADELQQRQFKAVVPALVDDGGHQAPFWKQHVDAVMQALDSLEVDSSIVIVGHSGAGALLPAIGHAASRPISAYIFVDAGIPSDGMSRLKTMAGAY